MWLLALSLVAPSFVLPVAPGGAAAQQLLGARDASIAAASPSVSMQEFSTTSQGGNDAAPPTGWPSGVDPNAKPGEIFEVALQRPIGVQLQEKVGVGVVVSMVYQGSSASQAGVVKGDVVLATSASIGSGMWPKTTLSGVEAAIRTRIDGRVRLRLRRPSRAKRSLPWEEPLLHTYEVELRQPLGMVLRDTPDARPGAAMASRELGDAQLDAGGVVVEAVADGGSAAASGAVRAGDVVLATSGTLGDALWEKSSLEGVLAAISTRLIVSPTITLRMGRPMHLGPWARELHAISRGELDRLSADGRASMRQQRRELRAGVLAGDQVFDAVRDLAVYTCNHARDVGVLRSVLRRMRAARLPLNPKLATVGMTAALRVRKPSVALEYFERLHADGARADAPVYTSLIKAHAAGGRIAEALAVEQRMSAEQVAPTVRTYNTLMSVCARAGDRRSMLKFFSRITERGMRPTVQSWNVVLDFCARHVQRGRVRQAQDVLSRMRMQGLRPDVVSYNCLARACVAAGEAERLDEDVVQVMDAEDVAADLTFLNTVLDGYAKQLMWDRALQLLERQRKRHGSATPDATSYVHALRACVRARKPTEAARVVRMMRRAGLSPDVRVYSMLLSAYAKAGRLQPSLAVLQQMRQEGIRPNHFVYGGLMETCVVARQPHVAEDLFRQMSEQGVQADVVSYTLLIRALLTPPVSPAAEGGGLADGAGAGPGPCPSSAGGGAGERPRRAYDVLRQMRAAGGACRPNSISYSALIGGCVAHGAIELALTALNEMLDEGVAPTLRTFEALAGPIGTPDASANALPAEPPLGAEAAEQLAFLRRVIDLFEQKRQPLHGDVYLPALLAASDAGDTDAARALIALRRRGALLPLRRSQERRVEKLEAELEG